MPKTNTEIKNEIAQAVTILREIKKEDLFTNNTKTTSEKAASENISRAIHMLEVASGLIKENT